MDDHISPSTAAAIAAQAEGLWRYYSSSIEQYASSTADQHACSSGAMFNPNWLEDGLKPVYGAADFFRFCSTFVRAKHGFSVRLKIVELFEVDAASPVNASRISRWASIVPQDGHTIDGSIPTVYALEHQGLPERGPDGFLLNRFLAWTWNMLHEVGHLMLHSQRFIFDDRLALPFDRPIVDAAEEEEAWFFAACVVGLALGVSAYNERSHPSLPGRRHPKKFGAPWEMVACKEPP